MFKAIVITICILLLAGAMTWVVVEYINQENMPFFTEEGVILR